MVFMLSISAAILMSFLLDILLSDTRFFGLHIIGSTKSNLIVGVFAFTFFICATGIILKSSNSSKPNYKEKKPTLIKLNKEKSEENLIKKRAQNKIKTNLKNAAIKKPDAQKISLKSPEFEEVSETEELNFRNKGNDVLTEKLKTESNIKEQEAERNRIQNENLKVYMLNFIDESLKESQTEKSKMDNFNKFGISLYLAGAYEIISQKKQFKNNDSSKVLSKVIQAMGFKKSHAISFSDKYEEYLMADARYMQMFQAGRNAINLISSEKNSANKLFRIAIAEWNKPRPRERANCPVTVLFTDIVGSTELTQSLGGSNAQKIVRAHNRVVREALSVHSGKEVKHTGDGIMASFSKTSNAVEGAIHMQLETMKHNQAEPDFPLHLKIGLNTGEPIAEDDDLFGTVVQLSARIVDKATTDKIYVSEIVRGICAGKNYKFKNLGGFNLKGFGDEITLFEVLWK